MQSSNKSFERHRNDSSCCTGWGRNAGAEESLKMWIYSSKQYWTHVIQEETPWLIFNTSKQNWKYAICFSFCWNTGCENFCSTLFPLWKYLTSTVACAHFSFVEVITSCSVFSVISVTVNSSLYQSTSEKLQHMTANHGKKSEICKKSAVQFVNECLISKVKIDNVKYFKNTIIFYYYLRLL